ncbi:hypothetical protein ACFPM0_12955 [Pseudonocardia sulfidoxydans]
MRSPIRSRTNARIRPRLCTSPAPGDVQERAPRGQPLRSRDTRA